MMVSRLQDSIKTSRIITWIIMKIFVRYRLYPPPQTNPLVCSSRDVLWTLPYRVYIKTLNDYRPNGKVGAGLIFSCLNQNYVAWLASLEIMYPEFCTEELIWSGQFYITQKQTKEYSSASLFCVWYLNLFVSFFFSLLSIFYVVEV